jgi:hypothetical protein
VFRVKGFTRASAPPSARTVLLECLQIQAVLGFLERVLCAGSGASARGSGADEPRRRKLKERHGNTAPGPSRPSTSPARGRAGPTRPENNLPTKSGGTGKTYPVRKSPIFYPPDFVGLFILFYRFLILSVNGFLSRSSAEPPCARAQRQTVVAWSCFTVERFIRFTNTTAVPPVGEIGRDARL